MEDTKLAITVMEQSFPPMTDTIFFFKSYFSVINGDFVTYFVADMCYSPM